jgi:hypothetical protein
VFSGCSAEAPRWAMMRGKATGPTEHRETREANSEPDKVRRWRAANPTAGVPGIARIIFVHFGFS